MNYIPDWTALANAGKAEVEAGFTTPAICRERREDRRWCRAMQAQPGGVRSQARVALFQSTAPSPATRSGRLQPYRTADGASHDRLRTPASSRLLRPYNPSLDASPFGAHQVVDAGDLVALAARHNRELAVSHNFMFLPAYERLREAVHSGALDFSALALDVAKYGFVLDLGKITLKGSAEVLKESPIVRASYL